MKILKDRILQDGQVVGDQILKVDSFLNHQIDVALYNEMGKYFYELFQENKIDKIVTIESSGIGIACFVGLYFNVPVVFAKKHQSAIMDDQVYQSDVHSFTKQTTYQVRISKKYIKKKERILIIDDFLANGQAVIGLMDIINQAGAVTAGVGIVIEKGFQIGGQLLRDLGVNLQSLAIIDKFENGQVIFKD